MLVTGRRQVGKSFVLAPVARAARGLDYQATRRTETEQLRALTRILAERSDDEALWLGAPLPDWESLFRYVLRKAHGRRFLIVVDEFPYPHEAAPVLSSVIQSLWDHELAQGLLKLVLNGSHVTAMTRLERADRPLHTRRTGRIVLHPFPCSRLFCFVPSLAPLDAIGTYGMFGGLPGNLAQPDPDEDPPTNASRHILDPTSRLPFRPVRVGKWWTSRPGGQVDVVAFSDDGQLLVGECKWGRIGRPHLARLRGRTVHYAAGDLLALPQEDRSSEERPPQAPVRSGRPA